MPSRLTVEHLFRPMSGSHLSASTLNLLSVRISGILRYSWATTSRLLLLQRTPKSYGAITGMRVIPLIPSFAGSTRTRILQLSAYRTLGSQHLHHLRRSSRDQQATPRYC